MRKVAHARSREIMPNEGMTGKRPESRTTAKEGEYKLLNGLLS